MLAFVLEPSLTHGARDYSCAPVAGYSFSHVLVIRQGQYDERKPPQEDTYGVDEATEGFTVLYRDDDGQEKEGAFIPPTCVSPRSFILRKCGGSEEGLYLVKLGQRPSCQCYGYNRWQGCKHADAIKDAVRQGLI